MSYFFLHLVLFFFLSGAVHADLAASVEARYNALNSWQADFMQTTHVEMLKQKYKKNGRISVARPGQIRIEYHDKAKKIYVSNGKKLWIYKENETVAWQFDKPKEVISREALSFLSGLKDISKLFDVMPDTGESQGVLKIKNRALSRLGLTSKSPDADVLRITLGVDQKDLTVREAVLFNASGNVTHYEFKNIRFNPELGADLFVLPKEPKRKIMME